MTRTTSTCMMTRMTRITGMIRVTGVFRLMEMTAMAWMTGINTLLCKKIQANFTAICEFQ